jgi:hypothetical protein
MIGKVDGCLAVIVALSAWASNARAQATDKPRCADLALPHPVYGAGASSITAVFERNASLLRERGITLFYADPANCEGYAYFRDGSVPNDATLQKKYKYWEPPSDGSSLGVLKECYAPEAEPQLAYLAYPVDLCQDAAVAADTKLFPAVVDSLSVVTDTQSEEDAISAEALYRILKFGASASGITPWTTDEHIRLRSRTATVSVILGEAVGIPSGDFVGDVGEVVAPFDDVYQIGVTSPSTPLSYAFSSSVDMNSPNKIKPLAFQGVGQSCGYYPDSALTARDKRNVRSGLYALWSQGHFVAKVDESGEIVDPDVAALIGAISGEIEDLATLTHVVEAGLVPRCAMQAERGGLLGAISSYAPPVPCGCYFESLATTDVPPECDACESDSDCGSDRPSCNFGFCEAYREEP